MRRRSSSPARSAAASAVALIALLGLGLTGCAAETEGSRSSEAPQGNNAPAESESTAEVEDAEASESASEEPAEETEPADDGILDFGESYTWEDGLAMTVSATRPYKASSSASGGEGANAKIAFTVTIVNGTDAKFDASAFYATLQSGDQEAEQIFDSAKGLNGSPMTPLLPGRQATFDVGWGVNDPADLVLEITADYEHESVLYANVQ